MPDEAVLSMKYGAACSPWGSTTGWGLPVQPVRALEAAAQTATARPIVATRRPHRRWHMVILTRFMAFASQLRLVWCGSLVQLVQDVPVPLFKLRVAHPVD